MVEQKARERMDRDGFGPGRVAITRQLEKRVCSPRGFIFVRPRFIFRPAALVSMETSPGPGVNARVLPGNRDEKRELPGQRNVFAVVDSVMQRGIMIITRRNSCNSRVIREKSFISRGIACARPGSTWITAFCYARRRDNEGTRYLTIVRLNRRSK